MAVTIIPFGKTQNGQTVHKVILKNDRLAAEIMTLGCTILSLWVPDKNGDPVDVALGFTGIADYEKTDTYMGMLVGRYANRIAGAAFTLDGVQYKLDKNEGENHIHGGGGFSYKVFAAKPVGECAVEFYQSAPDGENGYPGELKLWATYTLTDEGLSINYKAVCDKPTVCNFTNHSYFNLNGAGSVLDHTMWIDAEEYTPVDAESIPVSFKVPVENTPFDFRQAKPLGQDIARQHEQLILGCGYDHNFMLTAKEGLRLAAVLKSAQSGIIMETWTDKPAIQVYTANHLDSAENNKCGAVYTGRSAVCLETQFPPNCANNLQWCPAVVLRPGEEYNYTTKYRFAQL